jgi:hypothetical protein
MSHRNKAPEPIATLFTGGDQTLSQVARGAADLKPFQRVWKNIVPNPANKFIHPAFFRDGRLTIWVESPVWANWVRHRNSLIIDCIHAQGLPEVHTLTVRVVPKQRAKSAIEREKPSAATREIIHKAARSIADPELRNSLERLVRALKKP